MFAFCGLFCEGEGLGGARTWRYDTPDSIDEVTSSGYFEEVTELFQAGDMLGINAPDGAVNLPIVFPPKREAPSALLH